LKISSDIIVGYYLACGLSVAKNQGRMKKHIEITSMTVLLAVISLHLSADADGRSPKKDKQIAARVRQFFPESK
jgi:hypothetical protein